MHKEFIKLISILILMGFSVISPSQDWDRLEISLLTCGQGDQLYATFGHSALRVQDPSIAYDVVYNWGTFDFSTPFFYLKFLQGKLPYFVSMASFNDFLREYKYYERSVVEQKFNLSKDQKIRLLAILQETVKPENRFYPYDFFYDNCSTRIRDVVNESVDNQIAWQDQQSSITWRDQLHESLVSKPWSEFGIDLIIGSKSDKVAGPAKQMFLPRYLYDYFDTAEIEDTMSKPLIESVVPIITFEDTDQRRNQRPWLTPHLLFLILLLIEGIIWWTYRKKTYPSWIKYYHNLLFIIAGIGSVIILFLWFFTNHQATRPNWNIIWVSPLYFIYPFIKKNKPLKLVIKTILVAGIGMALINTLFPFLPQDFNHYNLGAYALLLVIIYLDNNMFKPAL